MKPSSHVRLSVRLYERCERYKAALEKKGLIRAFCQKKPLIH